MYWIDKRMNWKIKRTPTDFKKKVTYSLKLFNGREFLVLALNCPFESPRHRNWDLQRHRKLLKKCVFFSNACWKTATTLCWTILKIVNTARTVKKRLTNKVGNFLFKKTINIGTYEWRNTRCFQQYLRGFFIKTINFWKYMQ